MKKYPNLDLDIDDLIGTLNESLIRVADRFDPDLGNKFSTYAWVALYRDGVRWVKKEGERMAKHRSLIDKMEHESKRKKHHTLADMSQVNLKVTIDYANLAIKTKKQRDIVECYLHNPSLKKEDIAKEVGVSTAYVKEVIRRYKAKAGQRP